MEVDFVKKKKKKEWKWIVEHSFSNIIILIRILPTYIKNHPLFIHVSLGLNCSLGSETTMAHY